MKEEEEVEEEYRNHEREGGEGLSKSEGESLLFTKLKDRVVKALHTAHKKH